ncbi:hypothetical protein N9Y08_04000 [Paracoccaceae bacterium]|nr:hypothetical protein [Paracoccaceae bacterium]
MKKGQQYQLSLSDPEVKIQAQAMIMHNNNEDFINSRLTEDAGFSLTNAERNLRIKQLSFQSSQAEHWAFEALREARRSRHAAQATLGVVLSFAAMLIVIISFKL